HRDGGRKKIDVDVHHFSIYILDLRFPSSIAAALVQEDEPMKLWLPQAVINTRVIDQKIGHPVSGFDCKIFVAGVTAQRAVAIVDAYLRNQREREFSHCVKTEQNALRADSGNVRAVLM